MGTEQIYDAVFERISKNKKGMDPQHYYIYLAVMIKFVGLLVIIGIAFFMIFDVPQVVAKEIASLPTRPPKPTDIPVTATATATETPVPTATMTLVVETIDVALPVEATPVPTETVIQNTPTTIPTIERFEASDPSQNIEIGIPLDGFTADELPLVISQPYGVVTEFRDSGHHGVDFGYYDFQGEYILGHPINAVFSGTVAGILIDRPPLGHAVMVETPYETLPAEYSEALGIQPGYSLYILYAHLNEEPAFVIGDPISWQQQVGTVGKSQTAEAHLHLETRIGLSGFTFDSMAYYDTATTEEERAMYMRWRTSGDFHPFDPMILFTDLYNN
jgi:murein DD-endopeptidase MepM/ murein hydrolase activator NlpD